MFLRHKCLDSESFQISSASTRRTDDGFALVTVVWMTGILAMAAFVATSAASSRLRTVEVLIANAEAEAAADAGVTLALAAIQEQSRNNPTAFLLTPTIMCRLDEHTTIRVDVGDEAGKLDLNFATEDSLRALLVGLGWSSDVASDRIAALRDYIDADNQPRSNGGEEPEYRDAGRNIGPRNGPLVSIFELGQVLGFELASLSNIYPHVTVHSGQTGVDPLLASAELRALLESGAKNEKIDTTKRLPDAPQMPAAFRTRSTQFAITVTSQGVSLKGAHVAREAVVHLSKERFNERSARYSVGRWSRASGSSKLLPVALPGELKPCRSHPK